MSTWVFGTIVQHKAGDSVVSVRDLPDVVTSGDSEIEALKLAADAIEVSIGFRMKRGEAPPVATPLQDGENPVSLSALSAAKASLYEVRRETGISKSELARRMGQAETEARRILELGHRTKLDRLEEAAKALGVRLTIGIVPV